MITAGEVLKRKREKLGKDLDVVSNDTKIQRRFLEYLEANQFDKFDSDIFASGFIKIYSKYLGLDVEKLLALYRRSRPENLKKQGKTTTKPKKKKFNFVITPKLISILLIIFFLLGVVGYIGLQIYKFQTPPQLTISEPLNDTKTETSTILVKGMTDSTANIEINGLPVQKDSTGWFEKEVELSPGVNTINIKARKDSNSLLETTESIRVTYEVEQQPQDTPAQEQPKSDENIIKLQILNSSAWIKLDVDDVNKLSQILEPSTEKEYTVKSKFSIITGRAQSTKLFFNGEEVSLGATQGTGVAQLDCQISEKDIVCN